MKKRILICFGRNIQSWRMVKFCIVCPKRGKIAKPYFHLLIWLRSALKYIQKLYSQHFKRFHYCNIVPLPFKLRYFCCPNISHYTYIYNVGDYILLGAWQYRLEDCFSCLIKLKMLNKFNDEWKDQKSGATGLWSHHQLHYVNRK